MIIRVLQPFQSPENRFFSFACPFGRKKRNHEALDFTHLFVALWQAMKLLAFAEKY